MEQSPLQEANSHFTSQEIPWLLWNPKDYSVCTSPPFFPHTKRKMLTKPYSLTSLQYVKIVICENWEFQVIHLNALVC
jgi:hypothetical protein